MTKENSSRWKPGTSGNPRGRPVGSGSVQLLRREIESVVPDIIEKMAERALQGDVAAARLLLERSVPPLRPVEPLQAFNLPQAGLGEQARAIVALGASGGLSVGQVAQLVGAISTLGRLVEVEALEARLAALESRLETQGNL